MIPVQDVIPTRTTPVATLTLIALHVAGFLTPFIVGASTDATSVLQSEWWLTRAARGLWQMFSPNSALQFVVNVLFLWLFGGNVEDQLGRWRFVLLYVICGTVATIAHATVDPGSIIEISASEAVAGIVGAYFVLYPQSRVLMFVPIPLSLHEIPAVFFLAIWFVLQSLSLAVGRSALELVDSGIPGVLLAQLAGLLCGALLCRLLRLPERKRVEWWSP